MERQVQSKIEGYESRPLLRSRWNGRRQGLDPVDHPGVQARCVLYVPALDAGTGFGVQGGPRGHGRRIIGSVVLG